MRQRITDFISKGRLRRWLPSAHSILSWYALIVICICLSIVLFTALGSSSMTTEAFSEEADHDRFHRKMSRSIFYLQTLEGDLSNKPKHSNLLSDLFNDLVKRRDFAVDAELWRQLYFRSVWHYPNVERIGTIPCILVTKHNHILKFYIKQKISRLTADVPIVHFDTHDDMGHIEKAASLRQKYTKFIKRGDVGAARSAQRQVDDIGSCISGVLFTTGLRNVIWVMPKWIPDREHDVRFYIESLKGLDSRLASADVAAHNTPTMTFLHKSNKEVEPVQRFSMINLSIGHRNAKFQRLSSLIESRYILDIDLDYFCCNGQPFDKSYLDGDVYDVSSDHRTDRLDLTETPRYIYDDNILMRAYQMAADTEIEAIDHRLEDFKQILQYLRQQNQLPVLISICDSSSPDFSACTSCASVTNAYTPQHIVLYIHRRLLQIITELFSQ